MTPAAPRTITWNVYSTDYALFSNKHRWVSPLLFQPMVDAPEPKVGAARARPKLLKNQRRRGGATPTTHADTVSV